LELMSRQRTLTDAEIDTVTGRVVDRLKTEFRATLRSVQ
jgi:phenylalanyl-tRNA synthetase beta subunit